jgi:hypothetical protein
MNGLSVKSSQIASMDKDRLDIRPSVGSARQDSQSARYRRHLWRVEQMSRKLSEV